LLLHLFQMRAGLVFVEAPAIAGVDAKAAPVLLPLLLRPLLAAFGVGPGLDVRNFRTCLHPLPDLGHGLAINLRLLANLPIRLFRLRLDQLGDHIALLLGIEMSPVNVGAKDKTGRITDPVGTLGEARLDIDGAASAKPVSPVEDLSLEQNDWHEQTIRLDVGFQVLIFAVPHRGHEVGERVEFKLLGLGAGDRHRDLLRVRKTALAGRDREC
jgi:hypothetical protein